jgi:hypothetical protein
MDAIEVPEYAATEPNPGRDLVHIFGSLSLSGWGGDNAKILPERRTMRRHIGVHKHLRRTGRQLRLKLGAQLVIH